MRFNSGFKGLISILFRNLSPLPVTVFFGAQSGRHPQTERTQNCVEWGKGRRSRRVCMGKVSCDSERKKDGESNLTRRYSRSQQNCIKYKLLSCQPNSFLLSCQPIRFFYSRANQPVFYSRANQTVFYSRANQPVFYSRVNQTVFYSRANQTVFTLVPTKPFFTLVPTKPFFTLVPTKPFFNVRHTVHS